MPRDKIRRLYESEAQWLLDEELLEDVGFMLYLRCRDILTILEAPTHVEIGDILLRSADQRM